MAEMQPSGYQLMLNVIDEENEVKEEEEDEKEIMIAPDVSHVDDSTTVEESAASFLEMALHHIEDKANDTNINGQDKSDTGDHAESGVSDAEILALRAKLRIIQEEIEQVSSEYYMKDDENTKLSAQIKEIEKDCARLQKTTSLQQTQIDKHRALVEVSDRKCVTLQLQVLALNKEIQDLSSSHKQAAAVHGGKEVRLNRALEEVDKLRTQLHRMKHTNKHQLGEEHQSKENLLAENKMLRKQKEELILSFKKQLKLTDVHRRQTMHFEAENLLSLTKEEFMKAVDWGKS